MLGIFQPRSSSPRHNRFRNGWRKGGAASFLKKHLPLPFLIISGIFLVHGSVFAQGVAERADSDHDGLSDDEEVTIYHTLPLNPDTDGDTFFDGEEIAGGYSPHRPGKERLRDVDSDGDKLRDDWEIVLRTDLQNVDTDGDGYGDGEEVLAGYDPHKHGLSRITKRIEVNLKEQKLRYFFGEKKLDEFLISSGLWKTPTPKGEFSVLAKKPVVYYKGPGYDLPNTKWNLMFKRAKLNYYIHGAYWHKKFGQQMSHGCVNAPYTDDLMGRLYDFAEVGTKIVIR